MNAMTQLVKEGPQHKTEGSEPVFNIRVPSRSGASPTITDPVMYVYKNGTDATSTFTTGSMSVSNDVITTKKFQSLIGGDELHVTIFATVDGIYDCVAEFPLIVRRKSGR